MYKCQWTNTQNRQTQKVFTQPAKEKITASRVIETTTLMWLRWQLRSLQISRIRRRGEQLSWHHSVHLTILDNLHQIKSKSNFYLDVLMRQSEGWTDKVVKPRRGSISVLVDRTKMTYVQVFIFLFRFVLIGHLMPKMEGIVMTDCNRAGTSTKLAHGCASKSRLYRLQLILLVQDGSKSILRFSYFTFVQWEEVVTNLWQLL